MIDNGGTNRIQRGSESSRMNDWESRLGPASSGSLSGVSAPSPTPTGVKSEPVETPSLPNWESVRDRYWAAAELFGRDPFSARDLALARLGDGISAPALQAESTALYNLLRGAAMYGLVEWLGGDKFAVRVLPDADRLEWDDSFYARAELLRGKVARSPAEQASSHSYRDRRVEVVEYKTKSYFVAYIGGGTGAEGVNRFVYQAWDPEKHSGVVLKARGKNIPIAAEVGRRLCQGASEVFEYTQTGTEIYRDANGLCTDTFLEVRLRNQIGET